ncbi:Glycosyltransferase-like protein [Chloroherpeton thalassium ATCC 35110]|uniref:Glycosyltransferase-like protein n=1 Tax=Chloroherpeton thalassium (strain ATCC 35110 / GB-78) TaxID=517418 RepID=B3QU61_CHLT3|nr:glycosyltransferase family 2 protein [Chloroherpeton thalassium]ACF12859.1 Glycosyltransferase-like protein [Chloroherpeton thalassium ATCC 35110]
MTWAIYFGTSLLMVIVAYFFFYSFYWMATILFGVLYKPPKFDSKSSSEVKDILVLLPAYKPNRFFLTVLESLTKSIEGQSHIKPIILLQEASPDLSLAVKQFDFYTLEKAFSHLSGNPYHHALKFLSAHIAAQTERGIWSPSHVVILDKDNLVDGDFFHELEAGFKSGYDLVQGQRLPLAAQNATQSFDATSEALNDVMFRAAKSKLGMMLEISGSGFGVRYDIFADAVAGLDGVAPGMDKNLMVGLLKHNLKSVYNPRAKVFEEKTESEAAIKKQRTRWLGVQYYIAMRYGWQLILFGLKTGRLSPIDYAISLYRPPRSLQLFVVPILAVAESIILAIYGKLPYSIPGMLLSLGMLFIAFVLFISHTNGWKNLSAMMFKLPKFALNNLFSMLEGVKSKNRGKFLHTEHQANGANEKRKS